jgi:hypothetical protein
MSPALRIEALTRMNAAEKKATWRETYRTPAPPGFTAGLLARAIAYRWQEKAEGGLSRDELRQLASLAAKDGKTRAGKTAPSIKPGTWLSRTWHGEVHQVIVFDKGYEYRGERFASLSAIAQRITGAKWSGPRFFGLYSPRLGKLGVTADGR